jgi:hypothetical protein
MFTRANDLNGLAALSRNFFSAHEEKRSLFQTGCDEAIQESSGVLRPLGCFVAALPAIRFRPHRARSGAGLVPASTRPKSRQNETNLSLGETSGFASLVVSH